MVLACWMCDVAHMTDSQELALLVGTGSAFQGEKELPYLFRPLPRPWEVRLLLPSQASFFWWPL